MSYRSLVAPSLIAVSIAVFLAVIAVTANGTDRTLGQEATPTPTATATATATATPTATASPTPTPSLPTSRQLSFSNFTSGVADRLEVEVLDGQADSVAQNAPGCAAPSIISRGNPVIVVWPALCVDPGEQVTLNFTCLQPGVCPVPQCATWLAGGVVLGSQAYPPWQCPSPTPTATPFSVVGHDARLTRISGVPKNVRLSPGEVITDSANIVVANDSDHTETIGVYVDVMAPGGCTPNGRVLQTTVTLGAGNKTTLSVPVSYSCSDPAAATGQSYSWTAVADHGADDLASCGPASLQSLSCFNALASDDEDPADNRKSRAGPRVNAQ
jgi:hypothetical protein